MHRDCGPPYKIGGLYKRLIWKKWGANIGNYKRLVLKNYYYIYNIYIYIGKILQKYKSERMPMLSDHHSSLLINKINDCLVVQTTK